MIKYTHTFLHSEDFFQKRRLLVYAFEKRPTAFIFFVENR